MNKSRERMEKTIALTLIAHALGYLVGEAARDALYAKTQESYSPLFVLLKHRIPRAQTDSRSPSDRD
ncbi:hypothetical protein FJZ36_18725 [Candidatus Poribacteria bacterium]|nr:hypothetical protein [Candidatus Poribacteria bacterium]